MLSTAGRPAAFLVLVLLCAPTQACEVAAVNGDKIRFDLSRLDADGLYGPADGLRALDYEFCIADRAAAIAAVRAIDASVRVYRAPGRIGCHGDQLLGIGNTHQSGYREVLAALARLAFVERIEEAHFE